MFRGRKLGYKGFVRDCDNEICIVTLVYDHAKRDRNHKHAKYTNHCFIVRIELLETGKQIESVLGVALSGKLYKYTAGSYIKDDTIYFFPARANGKQLAADFAKQTKARKEYIESLVTVKPPED